MLEQVEKAFRWQMVLFRSFQEPWPLAGKSMEMVLRYRRSYGHWLEFNTRIKATCISKKRNGAMSSKNVQVEGGWYYVNEDGGRSDKPALTVLPDESHHNEIEVKA